MVSESDIFVSRTVFSADFVEKDSDLGAITNSHVSIMYKMQ